MSSVPGSQPTALFGIHPEELAVFCRVFRRLRGMSLRAMTAEVGVPAATLNRLENGKTQELNIKHYVTLVTWLAKQVQPK